MSSDESKRNPSQSKPEKSKQDNSTQSQGKDGAANHRPIPFDDTGTGNAAETSNPQQGGGGIDPGH